MRICLITPELPPFRFGGIGQYVSDLAVEYSRLGHQVTVVGIDIHEAPRIEQNWGISISLPVPKRETSVARLTKRLQAICVGYRAHGAMAYGF